MTRKKEGALVACLNCGKQNYLSPSRFGKRGKFCSRTCYFEFVKKAKEHYKR